MSKRLVGGIIVNRLEIIQNLSMAFNGFPDGSNIGSTV